MATKCGKVVTYRSSSPPMRSSGKEVIYRSSTPPMSSSDKLKTLYLHYSNVCDQRPYNCSDCDLV